MRKLMLAVLPVFLLIACAESTRSTRSYSLTIPAAPADATKSCTPTSIRWQAGGSANAFDAEGSIRDARAALAVCDARRALAFDA
jgi:hypothetical protein